MILIVVFLGVLYDFSLYSEYFYVITIIFFCLLSGLQMLLFYQTSLRLYLPLVFYLFLTLRLAWWLLYCTTSIKLLFFASQR